MASILLLTATCVLANEPFHPDSGNHDFILRHKFYDLYFFKHNQTLLDQIKLTNNSNAQIATDLSSTDDNEIRIDLDWDFTFYGHKNHWISISPNGFLSTHAVQCYTFCNWWNDDNWYRRYIGPLMVDFNPSAYEQSQVLYFIDDVEKSLNVQWHNLSLWQPTGATASNYFWDFQVKLKSDGSIFFYYFQVPKDPKTIRIPNYSFYGETDLNYSTVVGLEDAAYQHHENGVYELMPYSPLNINFSHVLQRHIIAFKPRETCLDQLSCEQCAAFNDDSECGWCPTSRLCSDGLGREIFEYQSSDYCTEDEQIRNSEFDECNDYEIDTRVCNENDHVLAAYIPSDGASKYFSGVIVQKNGDLDAYLIEFDDNALSQKHISSEYVHKCSSVSFDYSSFDLPPHCIPHCESIASEKNNSDDKKRNTVLLTAAVIVLIVVINFCGIGILFLYRDRRRQRMLNNAHNMMISRGVIELENEIESETDGQYNISEENPNNIPDYVNVNKVNHPIISPVAEYARNHDYSYPVQEVVEVGVADIEMNQISLNASPESLSHKQSSPLKKKEKEWDMTPVGE